MNNIMALVFHRSPKCSFAKLDYSWRWPVAPIHTWFAPGLLRPLPRQKPIYHHGWLRASRLCCEHAAAAPRAVIQERWASLEQRAWTCWLERGQNDLNGNKPLAVAAAAECALTHVAQAPLHTSPPPPPRTVQRRWAGAPASLPARITPPPLPPLQTAVDNLAVHCVQPGPWRQ